MTSGLDSPTLISTDSALLFANDSTFDADGKRSVLEISLAVSS
ncbi:MAG: hypothetical protein SO149_02485 [Candidatus Fimenecus sp.]|nr:hypothetical protein [Candidatus Fimenecus sp.]